MRHGILTLYEGNYHLGVGALINSAIVSGFKGRFFVGYRDALPPWVGALNRLREEVYLVDSCELVFFRCDPARHLTYHKPFAALKILENYPDLDTVFYADPDVLFLAPWLYFEKWVGSGVALCLDANFPVMGAFHPWRCDWRKMIASAQLTVDNETTSYYNGGFFGAKREDAALLENWAALTTGFEQQGGRTDAMDTANFLISVRSDQELLAAAAMTFSRISELGHEGMGFNGHCCILSHAIEPKKPWTCNFLREAFSAVPASRASKYFMQYTQAPIQLYTKNQYRMKMANLRLSQLVSRFYVKNG